MQILLVSTRIYGIGIVFYYIKTCYGCNGIPDIYDTMDLWDDDEKNMDFVLTFNAVSIKIAYATQFPQINLGYIFIRLSYKSN